MKTSIVTASLVLLVVTTGCGMGQGEGNKYEGLYQATGSLTFMANGKGETEPASGFRTIAEGLNSELIYSDGSCSFPADIEGSVATIKPNTECNIVGNNGMTQHLTVSSGALNLNDGIITVTLTGTGSISTSSGVASFSFNIAETLTRTSKSNAPAL